MKSEQIPARAEKNPNPKVLLASSKSTSGVADSQKEEKSSEMQLMCQIDLLDMSHTGKLSFRGHHV